MGYGVEGMVILDAETEEEIEVDDKEEDRLAYILISDWQKMERW